jgi:cytochrome c biogenesis protein
VFIPEGKSANVAVLNVQDGILLQDLPFTVSLRKFHLEHYESGMPKRFASDILITDNATGKSVEKTIEVNKPFEFDGIMMYQASFEDGGSRLKLVGHDLRPAAPPPPSRPRRGGRQHQAQHAGLDYTLEVGSFRAFNIENMANEEPPRRHHRPPREAPGQRRQVAHQGHAERRPERPVQAARLRRPGPRVPELHAADRAGRRLVHAVGHAREPSAPFRFMRIPVDEDGKADTSLAIRRVLSTRAATTSSPAASPA